MLKKTQIEVQSDTPIIDVHVLTTSILSATILFMMLRYNKNFDKPRVKYIVTIISILFCLVAIVVSVYAVIASVIHHKIDKKHNYLLRREVFSKTFILDNIPIITSSILLLISLLLFYTVTVTSIRFFQKIRM
jgi:hypothetical protein